MSDLPHVCMLILWVYSLIFASMAVTFVFCSDLYNFIIHTSQSCVMNIVDLHIMCVLVSLKGLWLGIFTCVFLETGFFLVLLYKLDWKKITQKVIFL